MVEAATRHTSARALILITAPSQQGGGDAPLLLLLLHAPWIAGASGRLSRWRLRVRVLRSEDVRVDLRSERGEGRSLVCG